MNEKNKGVRLDEYLVLKRLAASRHQAADLIKRRLVKVNGCFLDKPSARLGAGQRWRVQLKTGRPYASRAGYKLEAAAETLKLDFKGKVVFDVGAHKGGFTDCVLRGGAKKVVAIDVGKEPLGDNLRQRPEVLSFTRTDVRGFVWPASLPLPDLIVVDVSFISLTKILADLAKFCRPAACLLVLAKPQFEAEGFKLAGGVVKNRTQRREILSSLEDWFKDNGWAVLGKTDSKLAGLRGNLERFYLLRPLRGLKR